MTEAHEAWPERIDPLDTAPGVVAYHLKKYDFATGLFDGDATVLDVACGVGYGSSFLGPHAGRVIGVELADEAIAVARARYRTGNVWFVRADAERIPAADASADAVTCFEGIEHFVDPEAHLAEVVRVLKPEGVYVVSTPHPDAHVHGEENPYHLHEFPPERFAGLLDSFFDEVTMLGQRRLQSDAHRTAQRLDVLGLRRMKLLRPLAKAVSRGALKTAPVDEATMDDFVIEPFEGAATEYVAACRRQRAR
jgi:SAM-dependent methyltransferase